MITIQIEFDNSIAHIARDFQFQNKHNMLHTTYPTTNGEDDIFRKYYPDTYSEKHDMPMGMNRWLVLFPYKMKFSVYLNGVFLGATEGCLAFVDASTSFHNPMYSWSPVRVPEHLFHTDAADNVDRNWFQKAAPYFLCLLLLTCSAVFAICIIKVERIASFFASQL